MRRIIGTLFKLFIPFLNAISIILRTHLKGFLSSIFSSQIGDDEMSIFSMTQRKLGFESKNFQANFWISQKKNRENVAVWVYWRNPDERGFPLVCICSRNKLTQVGESNCQFYTYPPLESFWQNVLTSCVSLFPHVCHLKKTVTKFHLHILLHFRPF